MKIDLGLAGESILQYLRSEGFQALQNRLKDQSEETKRIRKLKHLEVEGGKLTLGYETPPVLNVSSIPPTPNRGGSQTQMLDRLDQERKRRPVALTYPRDGSWWLDMSTGDESGIYEDGVAGGGGNAKATILTVVPTTNTFALPVGFFTVLMLIVCTSLGT